MILDHRLPIDLDRFTAAGLLCVVGPTEAVFTAVDRRGPPLTVRVSIVDGELAFCPARSAAQRKVLELLGVSLAPSSTAQVVAP